jgi:gas vesicle protein
MSTFYEDNKMLIFIGILWSVIIGIVVLVQFAYNPQSSEDIAQQAIRQQLGLLPQQQNSLANPNQLQYLAKKQRLNQLQMQEEQLLRRRLAENEIYERAKQSPKGNILSQMFLLWHVVKNKFNPLDPLAPVYPSSLPSTILNQNTLPLFQVQLGGDKQLIEDIICQTGGAAFALFQNRKMVIIVGLLIVGVIGSIIIWWNFK